jgi:hypothetical protein
MALLLRFSTGKGLWGGKQSDLSFELQVTDDQEQKPQPTIPPEEKKALDKSLAV